MSTDEGAGCFQNVDLDLTFDRDIAPLILGFGSALAELHRREDFAAFELPGFQPRGPDEAIEEYWRIDEIGADLVFTVYRGDG